ncbi:MAG: serine/threonine protein kinase [Vulcanimicrobiota bacterium]
MRLKKGSIIHKRYQILAPIKAGGMGAVYKAKDLHFRERTVALKVMVEDYPDKSKLEMIHRKFEEEANILLELNHPKIPRVWDHFSDDDFHYIVMDFIEGDSLETLLEEYISLSGGPVPVKLVVNYAIQLCDVLAYLHNQKPTTIIHRDIKPGNIILRKKKTEVVLVDFGLARTINPQSQSLRTKVGTVGYSPIEQYQGKAEPRSDLYALGVTMHHLICGKTPIPFRIPPIEKAWPSIHPRLAEVIDKAIKDKPDDRFQAAEEMGEALKEVFVLLDDKTATVEKKIETQSNETRAFPSEQGTVDLSDQLSSGQKANLQNQIFEPAKTQPDGKEEAGEPTFIGQKELPAQGNYSETLVELPGQIPSFIDKQKSVYLFLYQFFRKRKTRQVLVVSAVVLLFFVIVLFAQSAGFYHVFDYPLSARGNWKLIARSNAGVHDKAIRFNVDNTRKKTAGILFSSKKPSDASLNSIAFDINNIKGSPGILIFVRGVGFYRFDNYEEPFNFKPVVLAELDDLNKEDWEKTISFEDIWDESLVLDGGRQRYKLEWETQDGFLDKIRLLKNENGRLAVVYEESFEDIKIIDNDAWKYFGILIRHSGKSRDEETVEINNITITGEN